MFAHWPRSGIIFINDIIKDGILLENEIYNSLEIKSGFLFEIQTIKVCFLKGCFNIASGDIPNKSILKSKFRLPNGNLKTLDELSTKELYYILLPSKTVQIPSKLYWANKFEGVDINWKYWFKMNFDNKQLPRGCKDFNWKVFHGQINCESRLQRMSLSDGKCRICCVKVENMVHLLYECDGISEIWTDIEGIINDLIYDKNIKIDLFVIFPGLLDVNNEEESKLVNVILSITRWEIWKRRNLNRYENVIIPIPIIISRIRYNIKQHILLLAKTIKSEAVIRICELL